jgi:hypothetical protein
MAEHQLPKLNTRVRFPSSAPLPTSTKGVRTSHGSATPVGRVGNPSVGPKALDDSKTALAQRMHDSGESAGTIAATLGVSRATVYRVLAEQSDPED